MPKININMQWLIPVVTGIWAAWTWAAKAERDRKKEHARVTALYVQPLLSASEDLRSRIYRILEPGGLRTLRKRYSDGSYAEETLYLIARYFAWMWTAARHGTSAYTEDPEVMRLTSVVCSAFASASSAQEVGPFNFFHPEQKALGALVLTRFDGPYGIEFDTISFYEFQEWLASPPLSDSEAVTETLEALRGTDDAGRLPGRNRLVKAQNHLVDLIGYIEGKEGLPGSRANGKSVGHQRS